jgi:hypothetical protein
MKHSTYTGVKLGDFNVQDVGILADALKGTWIKKWEGNINLTVIRGHAVLSSPIVATDTVVKLALPSHDPFFAMIKTASGISTVLVTNDLTITLTAGSQLEAVFTIKETQNG